MPYSKYFNEALAWAAEMHCDQNRKGKEVPYINHLMGVASLVGSNGGDEAQVIGALLHDTIEDCIDAVPDVRAQILEKFGPRVLEIVEGCTDADTHPKPPWAARKQVYMDHLHKLDDDSPILLVSLADKVHNAGSIVRDLSEYGDILWERFRGKHTGTLWYYRALSNIFSAKKPGFLTDELRRLVDIMSAGAAPVGNPAPQPLIYFFHGLESGPYGAKYQRLSESFGVFSPDFQKMDIWERLDKIERETAGMRNLLVVGSSYGGLLAALLYSRRPERFRGLVLMAPALHLDAADQVERLPQDAVIIHGRNDQVVPIEAVREKCAIFGIQLTEVDDDHGLYASRDLMAEAVHRFAAD